MCVCVRVTITGYTYTWITSLFFNRVALQHQMWQETAGDLREAFQSHGDTPK